MKENYVEASQLPENDKVYLRRGRSGWSIVHPRKNPDGSTNYPNLLFGGKQNLFKLLLYIILALIIYVGVSELISEYKFVADNPCNFCRLAEQQVLNPQFTDSLRLPNINITLGGDYG